MKKTKTLLLIIALVLSTSLAAQSYKTVKPKELKSLEDSVAYVFGMNLGKSLKQEDFDINLDILLRAFSDSYNNKELLFTEETVNEVMNKFQAMIQEKQEAELVKKYEENKKIAEAFLDENRFKQGVFGTESGLQFKVIKQGEGSGPQEADRVRMRYRLRLLDGSVVEDTFDRDEPVLLGLQNVIFGMREGLMLMREGGITRFWMHPDLAYGISDSPELPAGSLLDFEVELIEVIVDSIN